jgi:hypothetical protein
VSVTRADSRRSGSGSRARADTINRQVALGLRSQIPVAAVALAVLAGVATATAPRLVLAALAVAVLMTLALRAPVAHLLVLFVFAVMVPAEIANRVSVGPLQPIDAILAAGLVGAAIMLTRERLAGRRLIVVSGALAFLGLAFVQFLHGLHAGYGLAEVAAELRVLLGFSAILLMLPIVSHEARRRRFLRALVGAGIALGLWGIAQWVLQLRFDDAEAVTDGNRFSTAGRVVGLYIFPVAAIFGTAVLVSGIARTARGRIALALLITLNLAALALTFERTFWLALVVSGVFLLARAPGRERIKLVLGAPLLIFAVAASMAAVAPEELEAVSERLASISGYARDPAVSYRKAESRLVLEHIRAHPIAGSGLGASMLIGRPGTTVQPRPRRYAENGYLWLVWKVGLVVALIACALVVMAILWNHRGQPPQERAIGLGAQAGLVTLMVSGVNFAVFDSFSGTMAMGMLIVLAGAAAADGGGWTA